MSGITLAQAQAILDALLAEQVAAPAGGIGSVSVGGRTVSYRSADDLITLINFWSRQVTTLSRIAAGGKRTSFSVAKFN